MHAYDSHKHPYVLHWTLLLVLLNFVIFLAEPAQLKTFDGLGPNDTTNGDTQAYYVNYAFAPTELHADLNGSPIEDPNGPDLGFAHVLMTMVTAMFVHASWLHIIGNMLVLMFVGPRIEGRVGGLSFLLLYFASGMFGWFVTYATSPMSGFNVGASGAVAGVMGAAIITDPMAWVWIVPARIPLPLWVSGLWFFGTEFWAALKAAPNDTVAHWAHVGGIFVGFASGAVIRFYRPAGAPAIKPAMVSAHPATVSSHPATVHPATASSAALSHTPASLYSTPAASAAPLQTPALPVPHPAAALPAPLHPATVGMPAMPSPASLASAAAPGTPHAEPAMTVSATIAAPAASARVKLTGLGAIKAHGAPASLHPPIAARTPHEAHVNALTAKRIGSHLTFAQWIILLIAAIVLIDVATQNQGGILAGIGAGLLTYVFLAVLWTGIEHWAAHVHLKVAGGQSTPREPAAT